MLHIILGILKIIGIIIGIILLLLLAVFLAVVFVPVRYRLQAVKEENRLGGEARISWLLHIISVVISFHADTGGAVTVRLFGIRLPFFGASKKNTPTEPLPAEPLISEQPLPSEKSWQEEPLSSDAAPADAPEEMPENPTDDGKNKNFDKIRFKISSIYDKIKKIFRLLKSVLQSIASIPEKSERIFSKIQEILKKPGQMLELAEEYEMKEVLGGLLGHLKYLIRHYGPRRIRGYLRFGTGDPASTGQLTGLIYLLLPAGADQFTVTPEFNGAVFETEMICSGHIRACHVIRVAWRMFRDKKLRRVIRLLRKRSA